MYPNLKAEMARKGVTSSELASVLGITLGTFSQKINGHYDFTFSEAVKIKKYLGVDIALDILFERVAV